ncbi:MAG: hypothetical protein R6V12_06280 [Candidatus Hydrogenedentota bacterium]
MNDTRTKSWWIGLTAEKVLGLVFVIAAALKAFDLEAFAMQIRYYHVLRAPAALSAAAIGSVAWETLLGVAMIVGLRLRGWTFAAVTATLAVFTGLILYAWYFHDLADCGCFGSLAPLGPGATTAKNVVFLVLTIMAWFGLRSGHTHIEGTLWQHPYLKAAVVLASCVLVVLAGVFHAPFESAEANPDGGNGEDGLSLAFEVEYEGQQYDTSEGEYFIAFFSDTCPECQAETPLLNDYTYIPEMPTVLAFLLVESEETLQFYRSLAEFPAIEMQPGQWIQYIDAAPPRFYLVRDGKEITHWDDHLPPLETILAACEDGATAVTEP